MQHNLIQLKNNHQNLLLLQGPIGSFFSKLTKYLYRNNDLANIYKINFNFADKFFYRHNLNNSYDYKDKLEDFKQYLIDFIQQHAINGIVCFGDSRHYHKIAQNLCQELNIDFWVFEEGYFRPNYLTLEKNGVNANTSLPNNIDFYVDQTKDIDTYPRTTVTSPPFINIAFQTALYHVLVVVFNFAFPNYQHHRRINLYYYAKSWVKAFFKKCYAKIRNLPIIFRLKKGYYSPYFILPLQVHNDSQITEHSDFKGMEELIAQVLSSFSLHANLDTSLIIKHHPMDTGFTNYHQFIQQQLTIHTNLKDRLLYVHEIPMPILLRNAQGLVTVNSTTGISALIHQLPVKVLGKCHYDIEGLTAQCDLDDFWSNNFSPNEDYFDAYRLYHLNYTQINGHFFGKIAFPEK